MEAQKEKTTISGLKIYWVKFRWMKKDYRDKSIVSYSSLAKQTKMFYNFMNTRDINFF